MQHVVGQGKVQVSLHEADFGIVVDIIDDCSSDQVNGIASLEERVVVQRVPELAVLVDVDFDDNLATHERKDDGAVDVMNEQSTYVVGGDLHLVGPWLFPG